MLTDHDKLDLILEGDDRLDLVKLFEKVLYSCKFGKLLFFNMGSHAYSSNQGAKYESSKT